MTPTMSTMKPINQNNKNSRKAAQRIVLAFLSCTNASLQALNPQKLHRLLLFFYLHFCLCPYTNVIKFITFLLSTLQILTSSPRAASLLIKILILNHILPPYLPTKDKSPTTHRRHMLSFLKVVSKILRNLRILHPPQLYDCLLYLFLQIRSSNFLLAPSGHMRNLTIKLLSSLRLLPSLSNISLRHPFSSPSH